MRRPQLPKFASASAMAAEAHSARSGHGRGSAVPDVASALTFSGSLLEQNSTTGREFAGAARLLCEPTGRKRERFHSRYSAGLRSPRTCLDALSSDPSPPNGSCRKSHQAFGTAFRLRTLIGSGEEQIRAGSHQRREKLLDLATPARRSRRLGFPA